MRCNVVSQIVALDGHSLGGRGNVFRRFPWFSRAALFWAALKASLFFFLLFLFSFFSELFSSKFSSSRISFSGKTHLPSLLIYVFLMANYSEVRLAFPSFCFFFCTVKSFSWVFYSVVTPLRVQGVPKNTRLEKNIYI